MQNVKLITNQTNLFPDDPDIKLSTVQECLDWCASVSIIEVDTETVDHYLNGGLFTLQLGNKTVQFVIDCTTVDVRLFKEVLEDESKLKILHNAKYDLKYFRYFGIIVNNIYDTLLAECLLTRGYEGASVSLLSCSIKYLGVHLDKEIRGKIYKEGLTKRVVLYAAGDVENLTDIMIAQLIEINKYDLYKALELENKFVSVLAEIEYVGFGIDRDKLIILDENNHKRKLELQVKINQWIVDNKDLVPEYVECYYDLFTAPEIRARTRLQKKTKSKTKSNYEFIFDSSKKTIPFLQKLGIDTKVPDKEKGGMKDSCDIKMLDKQKTKSSFIPLFIEYKETLKLITTYGKSFMKFINKKDERIHTDYWQIIEICDLYK